MNFLDILILLLIAVLVVMAWPSARRHGGCSGCCDSCDSCGKNCSRRDSEKQES